MAYYPSGRDFTGYRFDEISIGDVIETNDPAVLADFVLDTLEFDRRDDASYQPTDAAQLLTGSVDERIDGEEWDRYCECVSDDTKTQAIQMLQRWLDAKHAMGWSPRGKSGLQSEAATRGLELIAAGVPLREAAERVQVSPSTLTRAKSRAGMEAGKAGRRWKQAASATL